MSGPTAPAFRSKADLVMDHLREAIQRGRYRAGDRLVLDTIAAELGVSKIPVREAITRLTGEGLVELRANAGPVVPQFTGADVRETALLRVGVERVALEHAVGRHDRSSLAAAQRVLDAMGRADGDFPELNIAFHLALVEPLPHRYVHRTVESLLRRAQRYAPTEHLPGYRADAHAEHRALLRAVRDADLQLVLRLNEEHVLGAAERLAALVDG